MKKLNKFFAVLVALAMMATLCVSMAFADPAKQTTAPVTKNLTVPKGTAIPETCNATFTFELKNAPEGGAEAAAIATMPLNMKTAENTKTTDDEKNVDVYTFTVSADALAGIDWQKPGYYEWIVKEATYNAVDADDETTDVKDGDDNAYKLVAKVVYDENGELVVDEAIVKAGGDETNTADTNWDASTDGLTFNNSYYATTGNPGTPDPEDPDKPVVGPKDDDDAGLSVEKIVTGDFGDKSQNGKFQIKITVNAPQIGDAATPKAVIRRADADKPIEAVTFTNGVANVELSHNDKVVFTEIANGTTYTVEETDARAKDTGVDGYTATYENETGTLTKDPLAATVTNEANKDDTPPTGILISNLPYIALALVAIGGLVAYVVVRRRNADEA